MRLITKTNLNWSWVILSFLIFLETIAINNASLVGWTMEPPKANVHIKATLIDKITGKKWSLSEDLTTSTGQYRGKINVTSGIENFDIFYDQSKDDQRIVIADFECKQMGSSPDNTWTHAIPGVRQTLANLVLLTGPSLIYRRPFTLKHLTEKNNQPSPKNQITNQPTDETVDGTKVIKRVTTLYDTLGLTIYWKIGEDGKLNGDHPFRVDFNGYIEIPGSSFIDKTTEMLTLNINSIDPYPKEDITLMVHPTLGIGCPSYFQSVDKEFPKLKTRQLHFAAIETLIGSNGSKTINNIEVHIDSEKKLTRSGFTNSDHYYSINDFNLAVSYHFNNSRCTLSPFSKYVPGLIGGQLNINELIWMNGQFKYVGKTIYEPRARGLFDTWESTEYGRVIDGLKYDKVVTTQYMAKLRDSNGSRSDYVLVAFLRNAYRKDNMGKYFVSESRTRDISEFEQVIPKSKYQSLFRVADCFQNDQRMTLNFDIRSEDLGYGCNTGLRFAEENVFEFKESFGNLLTKQISPLRITSIAVDFYADRIVARVEFLEKPPIEKSFNTQSKKVKMSVKMVTNYGGVSARNVDECLKTQISGKYFRRVLYCPLNNGFCVDVDDPDSLPEGTSETDDCTLYSFPLTNQWRLAKEASLEDLHKSLLRTDNMMITMKCENCTNRFYRYRISNVLDYKLFDQAIVKRPKYMEVEKSAKLDLSDARVSLTGGAIHSLTDCYSACDSSDCTTFSYCANDASHECYTSSLLFTLNGSISSSNCTTYARDFMLEYQKSPQKQFIDTSEAIQVNSWSADNCAAQCAQSSDCFSFQYCSNNQCTLTQTVYTTRRVKLNLNCDIYTPKRSQQFIATGTTLVGEMIATENDLSMEQCAALCDNWKQINESCRSFNYCPKGRLESSCQLSKYTVGDSSILTFPSQYCYNFELINTDQEISLPERSQKASLFSANVEASKAAMSISFAFLLVGLALGIASSSIYNTIRNRNKYRVTAVDQDSSDEA